ncbi:hypothetical protein [Chondromyces apiculatus]|uniref:Uncharacterized protein n=1 Tax=Chondromyces apiculatus DSM 436 TaxID=1192034 RepID=A0A017T995_9BACT|nr:hypothetical protein [Chondromyces apiculatus]EYF05814.1 Hypothetical protein CAP_2815 [Chondromyces apiculatus DSM 436]
MRLVGSRSILLFGALLGMSTLGGLCGPVPDPPDPVVSCGDEAPPEDGMPVVTFINPDTGEALREDTQLGIDSGPQGGSHIFVTLRHYATQAGTYTYNLRAVQDPSAGDALVAENAVAVKACAPGWTETTAPVFINLYQSTPAILQVRVVGGGAEITDEVKVYVRYQ